mgnify:CR=1 FL=1
MSIEQHQQTLAEIQDPNCAITGLASKTNELTEMCKRGEISQAEYVELVEDVQRQVNIEANMAELEAMERLNTAINGLISIARMI